MRVVEAEAGERLGRDALRVGAEGHVEQEVVAGVREQRGVEQRVVADVARQAHPVRAGPLGRRDRPGSSAPRRCAGRAAAVARPRSWRGGASSGGASRSPVLQDGELVGWRDRRRGIGELGARGVGVERRDGDQERAARPARRSRAASTIERPSRTRSTVRSMRLSGRAGLDEVRVQGVRLLVGRRWRSRRARPGRRSARRRRGRSGRARRRRGSGRRPTARARALAAARRARRGSPARGIGIRLARRRGRRPRAHGSMASTLRRASVRSAVPRCE